ncbi:MAG: 2TM domain-containing protein [Microcoleaceae cyanobacterium]
METPQSSVTQSYIQEDAQEILKIAFTSKQETDELSREQLVEIAVELGISPGELAVAEQQWQLQKQDTYEKQQFNLFRYQKLKKNLIRYAIVGGFLLVLNIVTTQGIAFASSILLFWGLFLALKAWKVSQREGEEYERAFSRWRLKKQLGQSIGTIADKVIKGLQS